MPKATTPERRRLSALVDSDPEKLIKKVRFTILAEDGNVAAAARALGVDRGMIWRWIRKFPAILEGTGHEGNPSLNPKMAPLKQPVDT